MKPLALFGSLALLVGCQSASTIDRSQYDMFGAPVELDGAVPVSQVLDNPEKFAGQDLRFSGPISAVCQNKGCWMRIGGEKNVFVKFKDYAFFVPLDSSGREAVLEGKLAVKEIPVAEARHYLEDAGKAEAAKEITQPVMEVTFMASGVALKKPAAK